MKKILITILAGIFIFTLISCGGKYDDAVKVNNEFIDAMEEYVTEAEKASSSKEMARVITRYAEKIRALAPKLKELRGKYPELNNPETIPDELKDLEIKAASLQQKMTASFTNMVKYMMDTDVQTAFQKLQNAMMEME
ncbi:MAG: hypothetical protein M0P57_15190 [Syntrophales bacterium]|nr:hypothetical protein [Syntrophales bacterium]MDY0044931.1 hypothetical protein [Syntrophales bacterium]